MLDLCKSCKCGEVCTIKPELFTLSKDVQQTIETDKNIGKAIKDGIITWRQTFGCKYYTRTRKKPAETEIML